MSHEKFIVRAPTHAVYGVFGSGRDLPEALANLKKASKGQRPRMKHATAWKFVSELPFAPTDRDAAETEADCWIGKDGSVNWIRCERSEVDTGMFTQSSTTVERNAAFR